MPLLIVIYLAFIGLGLPDSLLGSAWPVMHADLGAPVALGGVVSMTVSCMTIASSLATDRIVRLLGTGRLVLFSVALTAIGLFGFSTCTSFAYLMLWAIPYGLGAGAIDSALNTYVAIHFEARHMNWLHCMWGIGAAVGPVVMSWRIASGAGWQSGYRAIGLVQLALMATLACTIRLWRGVSAGADESEEGPVGRARLLRLPGAWQALVGFFAYCALESSCGLWGSTFMVLARGISPERAAFLTSLFYAGITAGRFVSGILTLRLDGHQLQRLGEALIGCGVLVMLVARGEALTGCGLALAGLGCAPVFPQMIQLTPERFGTENAGSFMGLQMAFAYVGSLAMPPCVGLVLEHVSAGLFPALVLAFLAVTTICLESCDRTVARTRSLR